MYSVDHVIVLDFPLNFIDYIANRGDIRENENFEAITKESA